MPETFKCKHGHDHATVTGANVCDERNVRTIDITPSWAAILPVLVGVLQNRKAPVTAHRDAEGELRRMALLADRYVRLVRDGVITLDPDKGDTAPLHPSLGDPDQKES